MDSIVGEIRLVGFNYAPAGWALCNGQLIQIAENPVLFNLLGTTYGGDGQTTFAVPNMNSRVVPGAGPGLGLSNYKMGATGGVENVTLTTGQLPAHTHPLGPLTISANTQAGGQNPPAAGAYPGVATADLYGPATPNTSLGQGAITGNSQPAGGNQPHDNLQPVLALYYIISLEGVYPSQS